MENEFLLEHQDEDTARLLLKREQWPHLDIDLMVNTIEGRKRIRKKLPSWYDDISLRYPDRLCTEQCSSEETALFKASIVQELGVHRVADLTGGLGVDAWAFSQVTGAVLHNEMKSWLSEAVQKNLSSLQKAQREKMKAQISFSQQEVTPENISGILDAFQPDLVFMDPARRDDAGKKVFLIEDCRPDVLKLKEQIFEKCPYLFLKLSPMADISMVAERCGNVSDLYVVSSDGECKELLLLMQRNWNAPYRLHVREGVAELTFLSEQEKQTAPHLASKLTDLEEATGNILFEPGKSITKAGLFNTIGDYFGLTKLGRSTHLYLGEDISELNRFGKCFRILEVLESGNKTLKYLSKAYPQAEVTARNLPISSDALKKKLHCSSGGKIHLFAVRVDSQTESGNYYFVTERI